uniref:CBS domain-containing protein n=2 Tax=Parascaris univalens TaxID=6257 RepID=A0A915B073_PARUN
MSRPNRNVYMTCENDDEQSSQTSTRRSRYYSGTVHRPSSIFTGLRELMGRPRSESMGNADKQKLVRNPINKNLIRVQIESCPVESVYDLREEDEAADLYNDSLAFRRPRSNSSDFLILRKTSRPLSVDVVGLVDDHADPYKQYMKVIDCYELAPHAGSVVIVDKGIKLEKAFRALSDQGIGAVLVWDENERRVVSILTLTDFLLTLFSQKSTYAVMTVADAISKNCLVTLDASCKLLLACKEFYTNHVHRIAITEPSGDVLYLLTIKRILQAIHKQNRSLHFALWLSCEIKNAGIGTWKNIRSVTANDKLRKAAKMMLDYRISSVPIVDDKLRPVDVIRKTDIANALANAKDVKECFENSTTIEAVSHRSRPIFLHENDTVSNVLDSMLTQKDCRCMFIRRQINGQLIAALSLSDFISFILFEKQQLITRDTSKSSSMHLSISNDL